MVSLNPLWKKSTGALFLQIFWAIGLRIGSDTISDTVHILSSYDTCFKFDTAFASDSNNSFTFYQVISSIMNYYKFATTMNEKNFLDSEEVPFPTILVCSQTMHSKKKG